MDSRRLVAAFRSFLETARRGSYSSSPPGTISGHGRRLALGAGSECRGPVAHVAGVPEDRVHELERALMRIGGPAHVVPVEDEEAEVRLPATRGRIGLRKSVGRRVGVGVEGRAPVILV